MTLMLVAAVVLGVSSGAGDQQKESVDATEFSMSEVSLREISTFAPVPVVKKSEDCAVGVAVVGIRLDAKGGVASAKAIEAPSAAVGEAVVRTLLAWRFRAVSTMTGEATARGVITFYVSHSVAGGCVVRAPADVGYVGKWPLEGVPRDERRDNRPRPR